MNHLDSRCVASFPPLRFLLLSGLIAVSGCATTGTSDDPYARTKRGAAIGAAAGAVAGVFVGDGELDEILGSAAVGAGLGAGIGLYMDKHQKDLEKIDEIDVTRIDDETLQVNFDSDILFAVDSAVLSAAAKRSLDEFAQVIRDYPKTALLIQGFTDSTGPEDYNQQLSERRAQSVYNHLVLRQVERSRMDAIGYGEGYPVADNATTSGRALNRRVNVLIRGKA